MKKIFTVLGLISATAFMNAQIVINEVYGGGGNSGSTYKNDFVELKNIGSTPVTLSGATLQYASAANAFNQYHPLPAITLNPGQKYLIQESAGAGGTTNLPTPDYIAPVPTNFGSGTNTGAGFAMAAGAGKIVLANNGVQVVSPTDSNVVDFVGYGTTANIFEGTGPAPAPSAANSVARISGDTNNNAADFVAGAPTPQNTTSGSLAVSDVQNAKAGNFVKNTFVKSDEITFGADVKDVKVYNTFGQVVKSASVKQNGTVNVSELAKGNYIVTGTVNNEPVSQKILKD
ncbi:lamin tail domain-containing protein [Chryseobacterium herbae]|uniref:Lamin tail domain-containing protein n=1 Tax=Chryseobacterium herbae TaxID=2976476 RepID=A0ABT2IUY2_9FLAO|nr:lamin tail domain-containing protein [Chryseobacterium sp. pc1-10]MCT2562626.1 lamin tail domain-containing protein [Chryseobacterium sp. pc1-10]